jgi:hypothetical protein
MWHARTAEKCTQGLGKKKARKKEHNVETFLKEVGWDSMDCTNLA